MDARTPLINRIFQRNVIFLLLFNMLIYALGGGIAHYLGLTINWTAYTAGQGISLMMMLGVFFLNDYFEALSPSDTNPPPKTNAEFAAMRRLQSSILISSLSFFTITAILIVILFRDGLLNGTAIVLVTVGLLASIGYAMPPFRLIYSGIGELLVSLLLAMLIPAFSFSLQSSELHRYLSMSTLPLAVFLMASLILYEFTKYASDCKNCQNTLLVRIGWQKGWHLHNILLILGYLLLGITQFQGLPWVILWPSLLSLPIAIYQLYLMNQVAAGIKPRWGLLKVSSMAIVLLTAYLLTFTFWTR